MPLVFRNDKLLFNSENLAMSIACCCENPMSVTLGNMLSFPTSSAADGSVAWCPPDDPFLRVFCTDKAINGSTDRYIYSQRDYTNLAGDYAFDDPGNTPWTIALRDFASFLKYEHATTPTCGTPGLGMGNIDDEIIWDYVRLLITATGATVGPGVITFSAVLREMSAAYPDDNAISSRPPIGKWQKAVTLAAGQNYKYLGDVTLDVDTSSGGSGSTGSDPAYGSSRGNATRTGYSNGGILSCNADSTLAEADYATCVLHFN